MGLPFWSPYANSTPLILLQCARCRVTYSRAGLKLYFAFGMLVFLAEIRHRFELSQDNFRVCSVTGAVPLWEVVRMGCFIRRCQL